MSRIASEGNGGTVVLVVDDEPTARDLLTAHLKSLQDFPPSQGADTLSMKKAVDEAMKKLSTPHGSSN